MQLAMGPVKDGNRFDNQLSVAVIDLPFEKTLKARAQPYSPLYIQ